jgi:hypothetical protein
MGNPIDDFLAYDQKQETPMEKQAAAPGWGEPMVRALGYGAGIAGATLLTHAAIEGYEAAKGAIQKSRGFKSMMEGNPHLKKMDQKKVQSVYNTLHNFNPEMAKDPYVAGAWVKRINEYDYVDPRTIGELVQARGRMGGRPPLDPFSLAQNMGAVALDTRRDAEERRVAAAQGEARARFEWKRDQERHVREDERAAFRQYPPPGKEGVGYRPATFAKKKEYPGRG